jgi:hypothetical protein
MTKLIPFARLHFASLIFIALGLGGMIYACFAKRISFEGDFPLTREERENATYVATPAIRRRVFVISLLPLLFGIFLLLYR